MEDKVRPVHLFVPYFRTDEVLAEIRQCLDRGWTGMGYKTEEFEMAWRLHTGLPHAHFVNSATAGLHLAVAVLKRDYGWEDGDQVISTPLTFVSTNHVILQERLTPVFADVDEYLCLNPVSVEKAITPRTRAVLFVGLGGNFGRLPEVAEVCQRHGLPLILDAAHMAGSWDEAGWHAGYGLDVSVFSFHAVKNLPTADSGMVCFRNEAHDALARRLSWMGISSDTYTRSKGTYKWRYDVSDVGFKYHGNSIMAAMGLVSLRHLEEDNAHRRLMCMTYDHRLKHLAVPTRAGSVSARHLYQVLVDRRDEVVTLMNEQSVYPGVHYVTNTEYPMYAHMSCPRAFEASERLLSLPLHLHMNASSVVRVSTVLLDAIAKL